jgi:integrase/recombinase XerD
MINSLFDDAQTWNTNPLVAFQAFVLSPEFQLLGRRSSAQAGLADPKPLRDSSAQIYILMFGKFLRWIGERKINLYNVTNSDIFAFLEHASLSNNSPIGTPPKKDLNSSIRIRYLRMFERVFQHLDIQPNPAQHAAFDIYKSQNKKLQGLDLEKVVMNEIDQIAFMNALPDSDNPFGTQIPPSSDAKQSKGWKRRRDRAMQAMMLGAGLKVSEVIGIATDNVGEVDGKGLIPITVSPVSTAGTSRLHETQLSVFAVKEVVAWKAERIALKVPGCLLFPATLRGGLLNKATVYRQVKATFMRAGITVERLGGRTLRNSFAVRELNAGSSLELVGEFMGHRKRKSTEHYLINSKSQQTKT